MPDRIFVDSNILIYCYSLDESRKHKNALAALKSIDGFISTRVLSEVSNVAMKKFRQTGKEIKNFLDETAKNFEIHLISLQTIYSALSLSEKFKMSFYDAQIIAAALECGCTKLYSEDFQHQQVFLKKLTVINPLL